MIFESTNREEVIIRLTLEEAQDCISRGDLPILYSEEEARLRRAIHETEAYSARPQPGDIVCDPRGLPSPCKAGVICTHDGPCGQDCGGDHYYHDAGYCLRCGHEPPCPLCGGSGKVREDSLRSTVTDRCPECSCPVGGGPTPADLLEDIFERIQGADRGR